MDEGLKQRLVGATVLIIGGVLVIPWLLDGAGARKSDTAQIELPIPELAKSSVTPQPVVVKPTKTRDVKPQVTQSTPVKKPVPKASKIRPAPVTDPGAGWVAQVGSFSSEENATRLTAKLKKQGYPAFVMRHGNGTGAMFRVRVGPEPARGSAEKVATRLKRDGHDSKVVAHP